MKSVRELLTWIAITGTLLSAPGGVRSQVVLLGEESSSQSRPTFGVEMRPIRISPAPSIDGVTFAVGLHQVTSLRKVVS